MNHLFLAETYLAAGRKADARKELQIALQWEGYYRSLIDGAFGPGTRGAMRGWQEDNGFEPTGVLTTRQRDILQLLRQGLDNQSIARRLGLSVKTIETHRQQIMRKLNVHSIAELTKYAVREGSTPLDP